MSNRTFGIIISASTAIVSLILIIFKNIQIIKIRNDFIVLGSTILLFILIHIAIYYKYKIIEKSTKFFDSKSSSPIVNSLNKQIESVFENNYLEFENLKNTDSNLKQIDILINVTNTQIIASIIK